MTSALSEMDQGLASYPLGSNWRIQFQDADGIPLNMLSFEVIDFGAVSYNEIFQNVKTILATPKFSAALERLLGVDQNIVDLPINRAAEATVAILDAIYFWEPRCEIMNIQFAADALEGHLICTMQLKVRNVIYGTDIIYATPNIFTPPTKVTQELPPMQEPVLIPGPPGPVGPRGSYWFTGTTDPVEGSPADVQPNDMYLNTTTGDLFQYSASGGAMVPRGLTAVRWTPFKTKKK